MTPSDDQNLWNFIYSLLFGALFFVLMSVLYYVHGGLPTAISFFDAALIALASFRLIRLFVYDKIMRFVRDCFLKKEELYTPEGVTYFKAEPYSTGPRRTASDLLSCPWCFGVWAGLMVTFFYFLTPLAWFPIFVLAISGVATLFQLTANLVGWSAENGKLAAQAKTSTDGKCSV